jgi:cell division protein FtsB
LFIIHPLSMKTVLPFLKNKYVLITLCLTVWVCFFDENDLSTLVKLKQEVAQLEGEKKYYVAEIAAMTYELKELTTNPRTLEKFAREKYLMKRDNEEIFVIVEQ